MPDRRKQRYGDAEFDWDYRVDTTSATVGGHDRWLGLLHTSYQPTEPSAFHDMLDALKIDFREFTFIDLGSGKGRTLLMASEYPFRRIVGVELLLSLYQITLQNIHQYKSDSQQCRNLDSICQDARAFVFPAQPLVVFIFNSLPEPALTTVISNLEQSLAAQPRPAYVIYHNALLEHVLAQCTLLRRATSAAQYVIYSAQPA
jgi:hypothetical protein